MKPKHTAICNELKALIASGRITKIIVTSLDGKALTVYKLNQKDKTFSKGEKK